MRNGTNDYNKGAVMDRQLARSLDIYLTTPPEDYEVRSVKTRADVEALKLNWYNDGCYELEDVEGFEEYYDELKTYSEAVQAERRERYQHRIESRAAQLGFTPQQMEFIETLERKIEHLQDAILNGI